MKSMAVKFFGVFIMLLAVTEAKKDDPDYEEVKQGLGLPPFSSHAYEMVKIFYKQFYKSKSLTVETKVDSTTNPEHELLIFYKIENSQGKKDDEIVTEGKSQLRNAVQGQLNNLKGYIDGAWMPLLDAITKTDGGAFTIYKTEEGIGYIILYFYKKLTPQYKEAYESLDLQIPYNKEAEVTAAAFTAEKSMEDIGDVKVRGGCIMMDEGGFYFQIKVNGFINQAMANGVKELKRLIANFWIPDERVQLKKAKINELLTLATNGGLHVRQLQKGRPRATEDYLLLCWFNIPKTTRAQAEFWETGKISLNNKF